MARYTGADCRRCRREKMKLFLKGSKCESPKCPIEIRPYPPGEHGRGRTKDSEYLLQKREKQKCARIYGVLEKQFRGYYEEANKKTGKTGENLLVILETRLDNVVYRAGFGTSRDAARQAVRHGHVLVNGKKVDIASYLVTPGESIKIKDKVRESASQATELTGSVAGWLQTDFDALEGKVLRLPERMDINAPVNEQLIVELYSRV
ncbi:MAG TPA: 30S ribosomal protein S4 [Archangium sp.]